MPQAAGPSFDTSLYGCLRHEARATTDASPGP